MIIELAKGILTGVSVAFAFHFWRQARQLKSQQAWMRKALREALGVRDLDQDEATRAAFQAGYNLATQAQALDIEVECGCEKCRAQKWAVN